MRNLLLVDSNYFCALYNDFDSLHEKAKTVSHKTDPYELIVSNFVLLETYTILSQRVSKTFAIHFGKQMQKEDLYSIAWVDKKLERAVWDIFISVYDKDFSYVDASILAIIRKEKISYLLSFDTTFAKFEKQFGFHLIDSR